MMVFIAGISYCWDQLLLGSVMAWDDDGLAGFPSYLEG